MSLNDRHDFKKKSGQWFGCLKWGHRRRDCRNKKQCANCGRYHPTLLHDYSQPASEGETKNSPANKKLNMKSSTAHRVQTFDTNENCSHTLIVPVQLHHQDDPQTSVIVYALLDEHADSCFVADSVLDKLGVDGEAVEL